MLPAGSASRRPNHWTVDPVPARALPLDARRFGDYRPAMDRVRALGVAALLALPLGGCGAEASPVPSETPLAASAERCAALRFHDVRDALVALDHYTYRGTDRIVFDPIPAGPPSVVADRTVDGAYQAPDRARELSEWAAGLDPMARPFEYPDFVLIGSSAWVRVPLWEDLWQEMPGRLAIAPQGGALDDDLVRLHARAPWSAGQLDPERPAECVFRIASATNAEGRHFEASLRADATTLLPTTLAWVEMNDATGSVSTFERTIDVTGQVPIEPPGADEIARETPAP